LPHTTETSANVIVCCIVLDWRKQLWPWQCG